MTILQKTKQLILLTSLCFLSNILLGQATFESYAFDNSKNYIIELNDGTLSMGRVLDQKAELIIFKSTKRSKQEIPYSNIQDIQEIKPNQLKAGEYWFTNPNATRYFFGPSAIPLKKGEGYYQNTLLSLNMVNVGVTDYFSMGGAMDFYSTFASLAQGNFDPFLFITPKIAFKVKENFHASAGLIYARIPGYGFAKSSSLGIIYGTATYGSSDHNLTLGSGFGFMAGEFEKKPIFSVSGMTRVGKKLALVSENWVIPEDNGYYAVFFYGFRFFGPKISFDLAFANDHFVAELLVIGMPFFNFVVKF